jgi:hypothetical protein
MAKTQPTATRPLGGSVGTPVPSISTPVYETKETGKEVFKKKNTT